MLEPSSNLIWGLASRYIQNITGRKVDRKKGRSWRVHITIHLKRSPLLTEALHLGSILDHSSLVPLLRFKEVIVYIFVGALICFEFLVAVVSFRSYLDPVGFKITVV